MIQIVTKKEIDPTSEFSGIWFNTASGSIWIWADKPVLIGHSQDGRMVRADVFNVDFTFEEKKNRQVYSYEYDYTGIPMTVIAQLSGEKFKGMPLSIYFGEKYGEVRGDGDWLVSQEGNIKLGEKLKLSCTPLQGRLNAKVIVLTYE